MKLFKLLKRKITKEDEIPIPGELYIFTGALKDPFPPMLIPPVRILDVKDGWVRYAMKTMFTDERMEINSFNSMYKKFQQES